MKKNTIHINVARQILNSKEELNLKCWKSDGSIMVCNNVVCTSSSYKNNTFNIKFMTSNEIRTIKAVCLFEVNGKEVYL